MKRSKRECKPNRLFFGVDWNQDPVRMTKHPRKVTKMQLEETDKQSATVKQLEMESEGRQSHTLDKQQVVQVINWQLQLDETDLQRELEDTGLQQVSVSKQQRQDDTSQQLQEGTSPQLTGQQLQNNRHQQKLRESDQQLLDHSNQQLQEEASQQLQEETSQPLSGQHLEEENNQQLEDETSQQLEEEASQQLQEETSQHLTGQLLQEENNQQLEDETSQQMQETSQQLLDVTSQHITGQQLVEGNSQQLKESGQLQGEDTSHQEKELPTSQHLLEEETSHPQQIEDISEQLQGIETVQQPCFDNVDFQDFSMSELSPDFDFDHSISSVGGLEMDENLDLFQNSPPFDKSDELEPLNSSNCSYDDSEDLFSKLDKKQKTPPGTISVRLRGDIDLANMSPIIPTDWLSTKEVLRNPKLRIGEGDLQRVQARLTFQEYKFKNPDRTPPFQFGFQDGWIKKEWVREGMRAGKHGVFWNPVKVNLLEEDVECTNVPDGFISLKEAKRFLGKEVTSLSLKQEGYLVVSGKKRGRGPPGTFVRIDVLEDHPNMFLPRVERRREKEIATRTARKSARLSCGGSNSNDS